MAKPIISDLALRTRFSVSNKSILHSTTNGDTTIYWGGSLAEKMISRVYFVMQSAYFLHFRRRHETYTFRQAKIEYLS